MPIFIPPLAIAVAKGVALALAGEVIKELVNAEAVQAPGVFTPPNRSTLVPDGIEVEQPTFDLEPGIPISLPPATFQTLDVGIGVRQSPEYQLIRSVPKPDIPKPQLIRGRVLVTRFNQDIAVTLAESISERKFGCLLHEPLRKNPVKIKQCFVEEVTEEEQNEIILNFVLWLTRSFAIERSATSLNRICDLTVVGLTLFTGPGIGKITTLVGCKILKYYVLDQISDNLTVLSIGVQSTVGTTIEIEECDPIPVVNDGIELELCNDPNTCFVPIRNLRSNLPGGEGYKTQLQIIFSDSPESLNDVRQISLPSPIDPEDITKELILQSLYGTVPSDPTPFLFGDIKYEVDVTPYGYLRYYGPIEPRPYDLTKSLFQRLVDNLVSGSINLDNFRASDRVRGFSGDNDQPLELYPVKALLFDFNTPGQAKCSRWDLRKMNPS